MTDGRDEESEGKDTQILAAVDGAAPQDLEGTLEMDRNAFFAQIAADSRDAASPPVEEEVVPATLQLPAVDADTRPAKTSQLPAIDRTQNYQVPAAIIARLREETEFETLEVSMELIQDDEAVLERTTPFGDDLCEFVTTIDQQGRIDVPDRFLDKSFARGAKVRVVMRVLKD